MTTPFTELRQAKKEQPDIQSSSQLPTVVPWSDPYPNQPVGYKQLSGFIQTHPTARTDIHGSSSFNFTGPLVSAFPQDSFAALSHSSTSPAHFGTLGDGMTGEWSIQHSQQPSETNSQSFDARIQNQGQIQPTSDFQPRPNLEQPSGPFIHLSGIPTYSTAYSTSHHHPLTPIPPATTPAPSGPTSIPARVGNNDILRENIDPVTANFQVQQYGPAYFHDVQPTQRFFGFSTQSPRSSISQEDAYSITLAMNQVPISEGQLAPETSNILSRGPNERQVGSLTVATSNLALSTPCTSPSVSTSPYSASHLQLDTPAGTTGTTGTTEGAMDSLGKSSGGQLIPAKGKRRTRGNKGDPSGLSTGDPSPPDAAGATFHKKIANKRSRDRLNQTNSTSSFPLLQHPSSTLVPYTFSSASSEPLPHTPSTSSSPSVASSSSISTGLPPQPPGFQHSNSYAIHTSSKDLSPGQAPGISPGGPQYTHSHPAQSKQFRSTNLQYHLQQVPQAQHPSYNYNTTASPPPPPPNAFADTYRNVRMIAGMDAFKDSAAGLIHALDSPQDLPRQMFNRRRSSQGYSSDTVSTPGEGYPTRSDYFGYSSLPSQPPQSSQSSVLYHQYQQDQSSYLHSGHQTQLPSQPLNMRQPQQQQQCHPQEPFRDHFYHQHQQPRQKQYQLMQQLNQQQQQQQQQYQQQYQLHFQHQQQLQLQHQQQLQHMQHGQRSQFGSIFVQVDPQELGTQSDDEYSSYTTSPTDALVTAGMVKAPRTRARSRTLPTLEDLEDIVLEPLAAETQALDAVPSQRTEGWYVSEQPAQNGSSIAIAAHLRTTVSMTYLQNEHRSANESLPSARIEELGSRSPSLSPEKESEPAAVSGAAPDLEDEVKEAAVSSIPIESSSSSSTAVSSRPARHPCPRCSKRFTRPFNLRSHMLAHDNERPYACDGKMATGAKCKSRFSRRADLVRHIKAKHPYYTKDKDQSQESTSSKNSDEMG